MLLISLKNFKLISMNEEKIRIHIGKLFNMSEEVAFVAQGLRGSESYPIGAGMILERISNDLIKIRDKMLQDLAAGKKKSDPNWGCKKKGARLVA